VCGFVAVFGEGATEEGLVERGVASIKHRGPDGQGFWRSPCGRVAMGHARLAIIDLSVSGAQPMISNDGRGIIAFNGEIYNFEELRSKVDGPFRSTSDTEVLLELLRKYGLDAVPMLRGMFAFAYWDGEKLHVVRDRLGIKPVFFGHHDGKLFVASEIQALVAMGVSPQVDESARDQYRALLYVPPPQTGFKHIHALEPAHRFSSTASLSVDPVRYWSLPRPVVGAAPTDASLLATLEDAVRCHLVADVPVGVFLSGGLDSSLLVALACRVSTRPLKTFTVVFGDEGEGFDERHAARRVAEAFGTEHRELVVDANLIERLPRMVAHFGQPFGNPTALLTWAICEAARAHAKVVLAGDGGDELFGGYPRYAAEGLVELTSLLPARLREVVAAACSHLSRGVRGSGPDRIARLLAAPATGRAAVGARWVSHAESPEALEYLMAHDDAPHSSLRRDLTTYLPNNILAYGDRMSMAASLEVRVPFCDHRVVEFAQSIPDHAKVDVWATKKPLRRLARSLLPHGLAEARKRGFNPPINEWLGLPSDIGGTGHNVWADRVYDAWRAWATSAV
jgi:asparagine synthase (glutamine-hydrolysing)